MNMRQLWKTWLFSKPSTHPFPFCLPDVTFTPPQLIVHHSLLSAISWYPHSGLSKCVPNASGFKRSHQWLQSNMHDPTGWQPMPLSFSHNLQMTALKLHCKHRSIACWFNPDKVKLIPYTYIHSSLTYSFSFRIVFFNSMCMPTLLL